MGRMLTRHSSSSSSTRSELTGEDGGSRPPVCCCTEFGCHTLQAACPALVRQVRSSPHWLHAVSLLGRLLRELSPHCALMCLPACLQVCAV